MICLAKKKKFFVRNCVKWREKPYFIALNRTFVWTLDILIIVQQKERKKRKKNTDLFVIYVVWLWFTCGKKVQKPKLVMELFDPFKEDRRIVAHQLWVIAHSAVRDNVLFGIVSVIQPNCLNNLSICLLLFRKMLVLC